MFDFHGYELSDFTKTAAPLTTEQLVEYQTAKAEGKKFGFLIDYASSELKGKQLLNYLVNVEVPFALQLSDEVDLDERFKLIRAYMDLPVVVECPTLAMVVANILLELKQIESPTLPLSVLNRKQCYDFILQNKEVVSAWAIMMNSLIVYMMCTSRLFVDAFGNPKDEYKQVDDALALGKNFVNLLYITQFIELYYTEPGDIFYYFVRQFEDPIFSGKYLSYHFNQPKNILPVLLNVMASDDVDLDAAGTEIESIIEAFFEGSNTDDL